MDTLLANYTTLRVGGRARAMIVAESEADLIATIQTTAEPILLMGGGSNLLISDDGFPGTAIRIATTGIELQGNSVTAAAGENWNDFVTEMVSQGFSGVEALAGIPGSVGATPIQNVGAYGQEVSQTIARVRVYDRRTGAVTEVANADCGFGYRHSRFKAEPNRWVVLAVTFHLAASPRSRPIRYPELARAVGASVGDTAPLADVRDAVLSLRRGKGMVLDESDHDTWSAGSFFTNPIVAAAVAGQLPPTAPTYPMPDGRVKLSAAWLIQHAGFGKGFGQPPATLSTKHTLALTNRGGARAADLIALARQIRAGVERKFGVTLVPEPVLVGCSL